MELSHRGIPYRYNPPYTRTIETEGEDEYQGTRWKLRKIQPMPMPQPTLQLRYCRVNDSTGNSTGTNEQPAQPAPGLTSPS